MHTSFFLDKSLKNCTNVINLRDRLKLQITVTQWRIKNVISVLSSNFGVWTFTHNGIGHENEHMLHLETAKL